MKTKKRRKKPVQKVEGFKKSMFVYATESCGRYEIAITAQHYDLDSLAKLFEALENTQDDDTVMVMPVIEELEDPDLLVELERRLKDANEHPEHLVPWDDIETDLKKKTARSPKKRARKTRK